MDLTNDQAKALFDAGCFIIYTGLPEGTEVGIDGTYNIIRRFSGFKFVPPGFHSITWCLSPSDQQGPGIPIRHSFLHCLRPKERVVLSYIKKEESVMIEDTVISEDHLKSLDAELAPFPFKTLEGWKSLTSCITRDTLDTVLRGMDVLDGLVPVLGEEMGKGDDLEKASSEGKGIQFTPFRLRRSWRDGAVGEEVTRYSKDKSWLFGHIVKTQLSDDPFKLLGQLQLSFILVLHLSSYGALTAYKRFLPLFTRSSSLLSDPTTYLDKQVDLAKLVRELISTLSAQLKSIPDGSFETELPELDLFFLDEIESLKHNLSSSPLCPNVSIQWKELQKVGQRWNWRIIDLTPLVVVDDESDEEGEYAPVIVDM